MLQPKTNPKWKEFVLAQKRYTFSFLATKMLAQRIQIAIKTDGSEANIQKCIDETYAFFTKYEKMAAGDLQQIFS